MVSGGVIMEMVISNPDAGTQPLYGMKGEDSTWKKGGFENEMKPDSGGRAIVSKDIVAGFIEATISNDMSSLNSEFEFIQNVANSLKGSTATFATANGITYRGTDGSIEGEVTMSGMNSTFQFKMMFPKGIEKL